jgi:hypothetical protein
MLPLRQTSGRGPSEISAGVTGKRKCHNAAVLLTCAAAGPSVAATPLQDLRRASSLFDALGRVVRVRAKPLRGRFARLDTSAAAKGCQLRGGWGRSRTIHRAKASGLTNRQDPSVAAAVWASSRASSGTS